jgi:hypothetical protein
LREATTALNTLARSSKTDVAALAVELARRVSELQKRQDGLSGKATDTGAKLYSFKTRMQTISPLKELLAGTITLDNLTETGAIKKIGDAIADGTTLTKEASALIVELDAQTAAVDSVVAQVAATAQSEVGGGALPILPAFLTAPVSVSNLKWFAVGATVLFGAYALLAKPRRSYGR